VVGTGLRKPRLVYCAELGESGLVVGGELREPGIAFRGGVR
jgi:hypothetical protein